MANLFSKNKLREVAQQISTDEIQGFIEIVKNWHNDYHNGSLKKDKETSREQAYNQDFFIKILGYREKPSIPYSFEPKATTTGGQLPDAVISYTDKPKDIENIAAVVELKGAMIELDRPQRREGNLSPVQQGFKYKTQYRNCPFVIVSNFWEFRLYQDNQLDYELWTLDDLVNQEDDYLLFKTWYALLRRENFTTSKGKSKTEDLLSDIRTEHEEIGKKFYRVYRQARLDLLRDIYQHNEQVRKNIEFGIEKAQKIIDRIVFACFAEDRGLLPDNTLRRVINSADNSAFGGSLWSTFKSFFEAVNSGSEKLEIPDGYNGGLFAHDPELNSLKVSDKPLRTVAELSDYNFAEDLSVTILGHIFEQSISDLEEIKSKVQESQNLEAVQQSRRKKDGIFYTPDYIVRYIVDNSLGVYLREREDQLKEEFGLKGDITDKTYEKRERQAYSKYQEFLHGIKVVDPACGSGAFLVYVFDYLLAENRRVASVLGNTLFSSEDYIRSILQNNIYGVDLNEESVEITKLSLWLKTAEKGKKLTALDDNIRCGNSLIDDPKIAAGKAFNWQREFPNIFANGGFDVVVGNPPYVTTSLGKGQVSNTAEINYYKSTYPLSAVYKVNTYLIFLEKSLSLSKPEGRASFIMPNTIYLNYFYAGFRKHMVENYECQKFVNLNYEVFDDATTGGTAIVVVSPKHSPKNGTELLQVSSEEELSTNEYTIIPQDAFLDIPDCKIIFSKLKVEIWQKSKRNIYELKSSDFQFYNGIKTGNNKKFLSETKVNSTYKPVIRGKDFYKYTPLKNELYVLFDPKQLWSNTNQAMYEVPEKLIFRQTSDHLVVTYDNNQNYTMDTTHLLFVSTKEVDIKYLLAVFNSKFVNYLYQIIVPEIGKAFSEVKIANLKQIPIRVAAPSQQATLAKFATQRLEQTRSLREDSIRFRSLLTSEFKLNNWPVKLNKWWMLDFSDFVKTLKVNLSLTQKDELLVLFNKYRVELLKLDEQIQKTDHEIDTLVYHLYSLTPEEITLVESSK